MKIVWSRRAIGHLVEIREHIERDSEPSAARVAKQILDGVANLTNHPDLGRPGRVLGTRELVIPNSRYVIPYRVRGDRLELIAVFHGRQNWPSKF